MSFFGSGAVVSGAVAGPTGQSYPVPAGIQDSDVLLLCVNRKAAIDSWDTPAGWTRILELETNRIPADSNSSFLAYKIVTDAGNEPAAFTVTNTDAGSSVQSGVILAFRGVDVAGSIFDVAPATAQKATIYDDNTPPVPAITTLTANATVVTFQWVSNAEVTAAAAPVGFTLIAENTFNDASFYIAEKTVTTPGVESPGNWLHTESNSYGDSSVATLALKAIEVNVDPVLDTPNPDVSIGTDATSTVFTTTGFSDANGDVLTYSVAPALPSGLGMTSAGLINVTGALSITPSASYTITADDGNGGTITDVISLEITAPVFTVGALSTSTPRAGESFTVAITNPAATVVASVPSGVLAIDSQTSTELTFITPYPMAHGDKSLNFESATTITVTDGTTVRTFDIQIQAEAGYVFGIITAPNPLGHYKDDGPGVADPSWAATMTGLSVYGQVLTGDYVPEVSTGRGANSLLSTYRYALYDGTWSPFATETFNAPVNQAPVVTAPGNATIEFPNGASGLAKNNATLVALIASVAVSDDTDTLTPNDALSGLADPIPAGVYTLTFSVTDTGGLPDSDTMQLTVAEAASSALTKKAKITGFVNVAGDLVTHLFEHYVITDSNVYPTIKAGGTFNAVDSGENFQMTAGAGEVLAPNSALAGNYKLIAYDADETFVIHADVTIVEE